MDQKKAMLKLPIESSISVSKVDLINNLAEDVEDKDGFRQLCKRIERLVVKHREAENKEVKALYVSLDPESSELKSEDQEQMFLQKFFQLMDRGRYKQLTDEEWSVATSSRYLLKLRIRVDRNKLDPRVLSFGLKQSNFTRNQFVIFHRGVSTDQHSGLFLLLKLGALWKSLKIYIANFMCDKVETAVPISQTLSALEAGETRYQSVERFHAGDIRLSDLFRRARVQEPIYKHVVVLYRRFEHGIRIKHYVDVPLADMELVLPAKRTLRPSGADVFVFVLCVILGSVMLKLLQKKQRWVAIAIFMACILYCLTLVTVFVLRVRRVKKMLKEKLVRDRRVEKRRDVLDSLIKDTNEQEVKLALVAYFALMSEPHGAASKEDLCLKCQRLIEQRFKERAVLGLDEAVDNLSKLGIIWRDETGTIRHTQASRVTDNGFVQPED